jgi:transcriptional regulator with XRE-family HTH domain
MNKAHVDLFKELGSKIRNLRKAGGFTQEDMIVHGFSTRHWQMIEKGRPITVLTLFRICDALGVLPEELLSGLYERPSRDRE